MADVTQQEAMSQVVLQAQLSSSEPELEKLRAVSVFEQCTNKDGLHSPIVRAFTRNMTRKWRENITEKLKRRMLEVKAERLKRDAESEAMTRLITRSVPLDLLAREWLNDNEITLDVRIYLIENLLPTLILGVEKLLIEVQKRGLAESEAFCADFNPINYLAQYLMRSNPKYSHFAEASPYAKGLRKVAEDLKKEIFSIGNNKLAKLKDEANRRRSTLEKEEQQRDRENRRRMYAVEEQFPEWTADWNGLLPLAVVQNMLKSFVEYASQLSEDIRKGADFLIPLETTDSTDSMLDLKMYKKYLNPYAGNLSVEAFAEFMKHLGFCAREYRLATVREAMRVVLKGLFMNCDTNNSGQLDRKRVLELLVAFYDNAKEPVRVTLMNPRRWPVREVEESTVEELEESGKDVDAQGDDKDGKQRDAAVMAQGEAKDKESKDEPDTAKTEQAREEVTGDEATGERNREATVDEATGEQNVANEDEATGERDEATKTEKDVGEGKEGKGEGIGDEARAQEEQQQEGNSEHEQDEVHNAENKEADTNEQDTQEKDEDQKLFEEIPDEMESLEGTESSTLPRPRSVTEGSAFDENSLNQARFTQLIETFLGDVPVKSVFDQLSRFIRAGYIETNDELMLRMNKARMEAMSGKRRRQIDQLYESWDVNTSGYLEVEEIQVVVNKWQADDADKFKEALQVFSKVNSTLGRREFRECIYGICSALPDEDVFDPLIAFLTSSVERSFEERKRSDARKRWMTLIDASAQTSGAQLDPVYRVTFQVLMKDAEEHGKGKIINASVCMLENNDDVECVHRGETVLRYVACTIDDVPYVLGKVMFRDMKTVSWIAVDSGKPIHVPKVATHSGVLMWNPLRKESYSDGSFITLPLKDHERRVIGLLGIDTMADPHKSAFITHEISFFQGVSKSLSQAVQFIDVRRKTLRVAESAVSWILRRSPNVQNVNVYLVEPGLKLSDGLVLRRMMTLGHGGLTQHYSSPPRLDRKDNLFRDYLFKCVESSETITADAYGERHMAFPLRDAEGKAVAVVDISIGELRALPPHENKEIQRMLRLLAMAHREVAGEVAGIQKNIVLEVEKEYEDARIEVLFDRLMLLDLRENVGRLDARAFAEIKSYKDPPKVIHNILKAVLGLFYRGKEHQSKHSEWSTCKPYVNPDLVKLITAYDPTARSNAMVDAKFLSSTLQNVAQGQVAKHGSLPAQYLFNWAFVCLSLVEHTEKMTETRPCKVVSPAKSEVVTDLGKNLPERPSPQDTSTKSEVTMD